MSEYMSSEELQRQHNADVFARAEIKKAEQNISERERFKRIVDSHMKPHLKTPETRALAKKNQRTAEYQLDLSADIVEILEKIKSEVM